MHYPTGCGGDTGKDSLDSCNCGLAVDEHRQHPRLDLSRLNDDVESINWLWVRADGASEAGQSTRNGTIRQTTGVDGRRVAGEGAEDEEGWIINARANWLARELFAGWRSINRRGWR